jgi:drug/metabolite transporter (DMT)-like permease
VNVLRLALAALFFTVLSLLRTGRLLPFGLPESGLIQLVLSGLVGFVLGDLLLFRAFVLIGARLAMLVYASVPLLTACASFFLMDERISKRSIIGMCVTVTGIALAVGRKSAPRKPAEEGPAPTSSPHPADSGKGWHDRGWGLVFAFGGAMGQAAGLMLGKRGALGQNSFTATHVRVLAGLLGFLCLIVLSRQTRAVLQPLRLAAERQPTEHSSEPNPRTLARGALLLLSLGAIAGPFLGVSLGLLSTQLLPTGIASTLMSTVPILLIPVSVFVLGERVAWPETLGSVLAVTGVTIMVL